MGAQERNWASEAVFFKVASGWADSRKEEIKGLLELFGCPDAGMLTRGIQKMPTGLGSALIQIVFYNIHLFLT